MTRHLALLLGPEPVDRATLGGKGSALDALVKADLPVPRAGVITTAAYEKFVQDPALSSFVTELAADRCSASDAEIDDRFTRTPLPSEIVTSILALHRVVSADDAAPVAVRSSATTEDLGSASFAGQYRSLLGIDDADTLLRAVRLVWASLWHQAPRFYRRFHQSAGDVAMAVVVMAMVQARQSGVAFTVDPGGAPEGIRIEQVDGLAEGLVSGRLTPTVHILPRSSPGEAPAPLRDVATLALRCEELFGRPQDVEWAWDGDQVWLVQSRPITVAPRTDDDDGFTSVIGPATRCTTAGIGEMLPGVLPVLRWSSNSYLLEEGFRRVADDLGALPTELVDRVGFVVRARGRAATNLDALAAVAARVPGGSPEMMERQYFGTAAEPAGAADPRRRLTAIHDLRVMAVNHAARLEAAIVSQAAGFVVDAPVQLHAIGDDELLAMRARLLDLAARAMAAELAVAAAGAAAYDRLEATLRRHLGDAGREWAQRLTRSVGEVTVPARVARLAKRLRDRCPAALTEPTWALGRNLLVQSGHGDLAHEVDDLVRRAGCRAVFAGPTWGEDEGSLWALICGGAEIDLDTSTVDDDLEHVEAELTAQPGWRRTRVLTGQFVDVRVHLVRRLVGDATELLRRREEAKAAVLSLGGVVRRVEREIGRRLGRRHVLDDPADVEHLTPTELAAALAGGTAPAPDIVAARRRCVEHWSAEDGLPFRFIGRPTAVMAPVPAGDRLTGWGASAGRHTGRLCVLTEPDVAAVRRGDVVVAQRTDASWSPVFVKAGAIVVEEGGPLSHAAIVARELGLPAVVNVPGAVARLRQAGIAQVTVDGDLGVVVIRPVAENATVRFDADLSRDPEVMPRSAPRAAATDETFDGFEQPSFNVFVPAIMSVGVVFSITAVLRDLVERATSVATGRRAEVRGGLTAEQVVGSRTPSSAGGVEYLRSRRVLAAAGVTALTFAVYVAIGSTANYLRSAGYVSSIAWLWAVNLVMVAAAAIVGVAALASAARPIPPPWAWPVLLRTPLVVTAAATDRLDRTRWAATGAAAGVAVLTIMVARPGPLRRFDELGIDWTSDSWMDFGTSVARWIGTTSLSLVAAVIVVLITKGCARFSRVFFVAIGTSLVLTAILRVLLDRPRPPDGAWAAARRSFPSGHVVQATLLLLLVPLAVFAYTNRVWTRRFATAVCVAALLFMAVHRMAAGEHWPTDVIGGFFLGASIGLWARASLLDASQHRHCRECPFGGPGDRSRTTATRGGASS